MLILLISVCAVAWFAYNSGMLKQWMGNSNQRPHPQPPPAAIEPGPTTPSIANPQRSKSNNIFDLPGATPSNVPGETLARSSGGGSSPAPIVPPVDHIQALTVREARVRLTSAMQSLEQSLAKDAEYARAKSDADAADVQRKAAVAANEPGSPLVLEAGQKWLDAKSRLQKIVAVAAARDPAVIAAQNQLSQAEAGNRSTTH